MEAMTVLIVEDEPVVGEMLDAALQSLGHRAVGVPDTASADDALARGSVDALTLDLGLPGCDAIRWLEEIARLRPALARRTLVVTGRALSTDESRRIARSGASVLLKPFSIGDFRNALRFSRGAPGEPAAEEGPPEA